MNYNPDDQVVVTVGGSEAIDLFIRSIVEPGDEILVCEPSFVCYKPIVSLAGGIPVVIETKAENDFRLTPEELKSAITDRTRAVVLPFPNNPTGAVMTKEDLEGIADVLRGTDIMVLSDEIYAELTYGDKRHVSIAEIDGMYEKNCCCQRFFKSVCYDRLAAWIRGRSSGLDKSYDKGSSVCDNVCAYNRSVCRNRGVKKR